MATFQKQERLCLKKDIAELFEQGEKWHIYPFRILLRSEPGHGPENRISMLVMVSKRLFRLATDRNRIKRQIREAYRLNKEILYNHLSDRLSESDAIQIHIGFIYTAKTQETWEVIQKKMVKCLQEICQKTN